MGNGIYTYIGYIVVWVVKYVIVPIAAAVFARIIADWLLKPQPGRQRKKRSDKNRFK
jgi:hypothetical protein